MNSRISRMMITAAIVFAAWFAIIWTVVIDKPMGTFAVFGISAASIAWIITELAINKIKEIDNPNLTEINMLSYANGLGYLLASLIANTVICYYGILSKPLIIPVAVNVVLLVLFLLAHAYLPVYGKRVKETVDKINKVTVNYSDFTTKISEIRSLAEDESVKKEIDKLQELFAYSANTTTDSSTQVEEAFWNQLNSIEASITNNENPQEQTALIKQAVSIWKQRNSRA